MIPSFSKALRAPLRRRIIRLLLIKRYSPRRLSPITRQPTESHKMTTTLYTASIPVFTQMLTALGTVLAKADEHAQQKKIDPNALLQARLFPDMFPLVMQVQIAAEFARGAAARLAGTEAPKLEGKEATFADLQALLASTLTTIAQYQPSQIDGNEAREIVLRPGTPKEKRMSTQVYLFGYTLPQFFFHVTTAYAILRHNGVEVGKRDYMGTY